MEALIDWNLSSELYDREEQRKLLTAAYRRRRKAGSKPELILLTGRSGVGKTALAKSMKTWVEDDWGFFLAGKFDQIQTPHAPFIAAVEEFVKQACLRGDVVVEPIRKAVLQAVAPDMDILLEAIPGLSELMDGTQSKDINCHEKLPSGPSFEVGVGTERHAYFASAFCRFLRAISSRDRNLVILLDDLQWADPSSLEILSSLLNPLLLDTMEGLMIIATCRDNEVSCHDNLSVLLRKIEDMGTVITEIQVQNLSVNALSEMVSSVLDLRVSECLPLAYIIHGQTGGNVFFAKQYIKTLLEENILAKDPSTGKWIWDEAALLLTLPSATDGQLDELVIQLLARKMKELLVPTDVMEVMKVAACLGTNISRDVLCHASAFTPAQVSLALDLAKNKGFVTYDSEKGTGHWGHDKHREACYSLILPEEKAGYHLEIGRSLRKQWPTETVKSNVILIVDQIKCGLAHVESIDEGERDDCARLFLRACREASKASAFGTALSYAELGIELLNPRPWRDQYGLSLDLHSTGAELAYCTGKHDMLNVWTKVVVANARSVTDKTRVLMTQIVACGSLGKIREGLDLTLDVLGMLDEPFPRRFGRIRVLLELYMTKRALRNKTEEDILALPQLTDPRVLASMQIIYLMFSLLAMRNLDESGLPALKLVNLTLKYGLSPIAAIAFVMYSVTLVRLGEVDDAARFGNLAITLSQKYPSNQLEAKVRYLFWVSIQTVASPWRCMLGPIMDCHQLALRNGDTEIAMVSVAFHNLFRIFFGDPFDEVVTALVKIERLCVAYGQLKVLTVTSCALQFCKNMQGCARDALKLTGDSFNEEEKLAQLKAENVKTIASIILHLKFMLATLLNDYDAADRLYRTNKGGFKDFLIPFFTTYHTFLRGLVSLDLSRVSSGRARSSKIAEAERIVKRLNSLMIHCPNNVVNKLHLLKAEQEFCHGRYSTALLYYDKSIIYAEREGFSLEHALACEKAGIMLQAAGRWIDANNYLTKALHLYRSCGAQLKADRIDMLINTKHSLPV
ncbi:multi-sensor signal transduction multi-kinase [Seminavis robusta]|uniref:Multi-sensor signal transduction multi-kinase n=1 Tax=Seminavis robusta TaxID=568900 RepID=A0A9N8H9Q9_9STRA|nr:multi-sensor signal transduction multi-kinase [Seminavis robusta]|eukprot:Sro215_g089130.1 multi-sensor signal transduction multi-kinase (1023) ;mRNA; r:73159-76624